MRCFVCSTSEAFLPILKIACNLFLVPSLLSLYRLLSLLLVSCHFLKAVIFSSFTCWTASFYNKIFHLYFSFLMLFHRFWWTSRIIASSCFQSPWKLLIFLNNLYSNSSKLLSSSFQSLSIFTHFFTLQLYKLPRKSSYIFIFLLFTGLINSRFYCIWNHHILKKPLQI